MLMSDVINKILSLPDLELTDDEWNALTAIMNSLEVKNIESFQEYLDTIKSEAGSIINSKFISKATSFVTAWLDVTQLLIAWIHHLNKVWASVTQENMVADGLIPLIIELLPNDNTRLELLLKKLEMASRIGDLGERGYSLTSAMVAITVKISEMTANKSITEEKVSMVASQVNEIELIAPLIPVCLNFKNYLRDTFLLLFQLSDKETYQQYVDLHSTPLDKNELIGIVIENLGKNNITFNNPDLHSLLEKYFVLYEMHLTLLRENTSAAHKLLEFSAKFLQHEQILMKNLDSTTKTFIQRTGASLGINRLYEYIGWEDEETQFLKLAGFFSRKAQDREPVKKEIVEKNVTSLVR